jgi:hypothetical protein
MQTATLNGYSGVPTDHMGFLAGNNGSIETPLTNNPGNAFYRNDDPEMQLQDIAGVGGEGYK